MAGIQYIYAFQVDHIKINVYANKDTLGRAASALVGACLRKAIDQHGHANIMLATGASQYEFLDALKQENDINWSRITAFHLDEYLGLSDQHPASFRRYLRERVFDHIRFGCIHLLQGDATDPQAEVDRYSSLLADSTIDVACLGIGENGHLAFNDPPANFDTQELVHIQTLSLACRNQQVGEGHFKRIEDVPKKALTLSIPFILKAKMISCVTPDSRKAEAVHCTLEKPISPLCPASALRLHHNCYLHLDTYSASLLSQNRDEILHGKE